MIKFRIFQFKDFIMSLSIEKVYSNFFFGLLLLNAAILREITLHVCFGGTLYLLLRFFTGSLFLYRLPLFSLCTLDNSCTDDVLMPKCYFLKMLVLMTFLMKLHNMLLNMYSTCHVIFLLAYHL